MRPFLYDAVAVAANPDVIFFVNETAMDRLRHELRIAPSAYRVSVGIILDDDWRELLSNLLLHRSEVSAAATRQRSFRCAAALSIRSLVSVSLVDIDRPFAS